MGEVPSSESLPATEPPAEEAPVPAETVTTMNEEKTTTNGNTPKTNGNNSHNGSEQPKNGEEDKAKDIIEDQPKNGELENGVKSNEESTDLSSPEKHSTGEKRSSEAVTENSDVVSEVQPAAKKLKTCEDHAPSETTTVESPVPTEDNTT